MSTAQKYVKLLSYTNETSLDKNISELSEADAKQVLKTMIQFLESQEIDMNDFIQFSQEQLPV